jgi:hypothetical protein
MLDERKLDNSSSSGAQFVPANADLAERGRVRHWLLGHYRFVYAIDLILLYLSSMFYITARIVTGGWSLPSRTVLVVVIGSGIIAALPFVSGENFEQRFVEALASPGSKELKRIKILVAAAFCLILALALAIAAFHPAHRIHR